MRIAHFVSGFPVPSETFVLDEIAAFAEEGFENVVVSLRPRPGSSFPRKRESMGDVDLYGQLLRCGVTSESLGFIESLYPVRNPFPALKSVSAKSIGLLANQLGSGIAHPRELLRLVYTGKRILETIPLLANLRVTHCHAHFAHYPAELAWGCSRLLGTTFSWNAHSYDLHLYSAHLQRRIQDADLIFPVSEANRRFIEERSAGVGGPESIGSKVHVHRCGIRLEEYSFGQGGEDPAEPILLGVGRLVDTKGFADLLRAASLLLKEGIHVRVRIIGEGPERSNLLALASSLGCEGRIELVGTLPRDQVREEQRRATLLIMPCCPGRNGLDGIPVVLMEAMALGTPVVATRFAAIPELVEDGVTGRVVPPNQPEVLAGVIRDLLESPAKRERLALSARRKVEAEYDGPRNYREKARLVREMIASRLSKSVCADSFQDRHRHDGREFGP